MESFTLERNTWRTQFTLCHWDTFHTHTHTHTRIVEPFDTVVRREENRNPKLKRGKIDASIRRNSYRIDKETFYFVWFVGSLVDPVLSVLTRRRQTKELAIEIESTQTLYQFWSNFEVDKRTHTRTHRHQHTQILAEASVARCTIKNSLKITRAAAQAHAENL